MTSKNKTHYQKDSLFNSHLKSSPFKFNEQVASVFPDMISRSVPGYASVIAMVENLARLYVTAHSNCYDLGCSLGEATLAIDRGTASSKILPESATQQKKPISIISIDNSQAMIERCSAHLAGYRQNTHIDIRCDDIRQVKIENASMVVLNYTLQFLPIEDREQIIHDIYQGLNPGGLLLISEKILIEDELLNELFIDLHHQFKKTNGYSELEISQKRNALENVLIPETLNTHTERLNRAGFKQVNCWQQYLNFVSILALKPQ